MMADCAINCHPFPLERVRGSTKSSIAPVCLSKRGFMSKDISPENRKLLVSALEALAATIERFPPPIVGSDIHVHAAPGAGSVTGQSISMTVSGSATGPTSGERISVVAGPGQSVIGKRITVSVGGPPPVESIFQAPQSMEEISDVVVQLRAAIKTLETSDASKSWIAGLLAQADRWGSAALSGAISGATNAMTRAYLSGGMP